MDHYILLLNYLSNHLHFITNGFKRFSKTNSTDPRHCDPLKLGFEALGCAGTQRLILVVLLNLHMSF